MTATLPTAGDDTRHGGAGAHGHVRRRRPRPPAWRRGDDGARAAGRPRVDRSAVPRARLHARSGGVYGARPRAARRRCRCGPTTRASPSPCRGSCARDRPALHHGNYVLPPRLPCPAVLTVSDCSWARLGESMPVADRLAFRGFVPWSAKRAAHITTISEHARTDLLDLFDWLDPARITVLPLAVDARFVPCRPTPSRFGLPESYAVCLGAVQPRKNLARLLEAWATVQARGDGGDAVLAIAGRPKQEAGSLRGAGRPARHRRPRALARLRRRRRPARAAGGRALPRLPQPLRGLRPARRRGDGRRLPGHRSDTTSLPETAAGAALLVDPLSPTAIAECHHAAAGGRGGARAAARARPGRAAKLSWTRSAEVLAGVYTDVMSATARR